MEEENPSVDEQSPRSSSKTIYIIGAVVVLALIIVGISLPPISIWERLGGGDSGADNPQIEATQEPGESPETAVGAQAIPGEVALNMSSGSATVTSVPQAEFAGTSALPAGIAPRSNIYAIEGSGNGRIAVTIPANTNLQYADFEAYKRKQRQYNNGLRSGKKHAAHGLADRVLSVTVEHDLHARDQESSEALAGAAAQMDLDARERAGLFGESRQFAGEASAHSAVAIGHRPAAAHPRRSSPGRAGRRRPGRRQRPRVRR